MTDGYGVSAFLANVVDETEEELLPHLPNLSIFQKFIMTISQPYHFLTMARKYYNYPNDMNPVTIKSPENSGIKRGFFAKEYSVEAVKKKSKEHNVTINDFLMTVISMTMKQFFIQKGDEKTDHILMFVPYNIREKPKSKKEFGFINDVSVYPI